MGGGGLLRGVVSLSCPYPPLVHPKNLFQAPPYSRHSFFVYGAGAVKIKGAPPESSGCIDAGFHQKKQLYVFDFLPIRLV